MWSGNIILMLHHYRSFLVIWSGKIILKAHHYRSSSIFINVSAILFLSNHQLGEGSPLIPTPWTPWERKSVRFWSMILLAFEKICSTGRRQECKQMWWINQLVHLFPAHAVHVYLDYSDLSSCCSWGLSCLEDCQCSRSWNSTCSHHCQCPPSLTPKEARSFAGTWVYWSQHLLMVGPSSKSQEYNFFWICWRSSDCTTCPEETIQ